MKKIVSGAYLQNERLFSREIRKGLSSLTVPARKKIGEVYEDIFGQEPLKKHTFYLKPSDRRRARRTLARKNTKPASTTYRRVRSGK